MSKLIGSDSQQQQGGDNSTNIQTGDNVNIQITSGLGYSDVLKIVDDAVERKVSEIQEAGALEVKGIIEDFNKKLFNISGEEKFEKCKNPSMRLSLSYAQRAYVEANRDENIENIILQTMKERLERDDSKSKILLNSALKIIPLLSRQHIDYLSFHFVLRNVYRTSAESISSVKEFLIENMLQFYSNDFLKSSFYEVLECNGLVKRLSDSLKYYEIEKFIISHYMYIFKPKVSLESVKDIFHDDYNRLNGIVYEDKNNVVFLIRNFKELESKLVDMGLGDRYQQCKDAILESPTKSDIDLFLHSIDNEFSKFIDKFKDDNFPCKYYDLSVIGSVLAFINCRLKLNSLDNVQLNDILSIVER